MLLTSFLGIGIDLLNAQDERDHVRWTPVALLLVGFVLAFPVVAGIGRTVARTFVRFRPLNAYRREN